MLVSEVMTRRAETVGPGETLQSAARRMREVGVGALAVCEEDRLVGFLTDRDVVVRAVADGADPRVADVRSAMTPQAVTCPEDEELVEAARIMERQGVRRLVVVDEEERVVGMLSLDDVALVSPDLAGEILEHARAPERPIAPVRWPWWE